MARYQEGREVGGDEMGGKVEDPHSASAVVPDLVKVPQGGHCSFVNFWY